MNHNLFSNVKKQLLLALLVCVLLVGGLASASAAPGHIERVSVDSSGNEGISFSFQAAISGDGRFVAFASDANNLVSGDNNNRRDIFVHDRQTGTTERVSVSSSGVEGTGNSATGGGPSISSDGRFVAFESRAGNLVSGDTNGGIDIFVHDRDTGTTERVSVSSSGTEGNSNSQSPSISSDGRFVAFQSFASNLVSGDSNNTTDIFVHDRDTGMTARVSVDSSGAAGNSSSFFSSISSDGRFVAFQSGADNLVSGDSNGAFDIFVHDRDTGITTRVSVDSSGTEGNGSSQSPSISGDGRFVAFNSNASNLVSGDTNNTTDIFVHDRDTGTTTRVSVDSSGMEGNNSSFSPSISSDDRFVAFQSGASNLVSGDSNGTTDIFVHDRDMGATTRVSVDSSGTEGNSSSSGSSISSDGRFVAFDSAASNLVSGDTNNTSDIFVKEPSFSSPNAAPTITSPNSASVPENQTDAIDVEATDDNDSEGSGLTYNFSSGADDGLFNIDVGTGEVTFNTPPDFENPGDANGDNDYEIQVTVTDSGGESDVQDITITVTDEGAASCDLSSGFNVIAGTPGNDKLVGTDDNDIIIGYGGNDRIEGLGGNDCLIGGDGNDTLFGNDGNDIIWGGDENNATTYSHDNDKLYGGDGNDEMHGGDRDDRLQGDAGDDMMWGDGRRDKLYGNDGNDEMHGGDDRDTLDGGDGDDTMYGGAGDDMLTGKDGDDHMEGDAGRDKLYGGDGNDYGDGGSEDDNLVGNRGYDELWGGEGRDRLDGGHEDDLLYGEEGDDKLYGGRDDDMLDGGADNDYLDGSSGTDTCTTGENVRSCEL